MLNETISQPEPSSPETAFIKITQDEYRHNIKKYLELSRNGKQVQVLDDEQMLMILGRGKKVFMDLDEESDSWLD